MDDSSPQRLNKYLALASGSSRREADEWIAAGEISVNGTIAQLGARVTHDDIITRNGKAVAQTMQKTYLLFNKPAGYVCSRKKQGDSDTIYALLPKQYYALKPVGRLDRDSSGLLLLTNDGDFAHQMTHPKFHKVKIYQVKLDKQLQPLHQQMVSDFGVMLEDGKSQFIVEKIDDLSKEQNETNITYQITMSEGRNRQIRRTFAALGYTVSYLHRIQFGNYQLADLPVGKYKIINP